MSDEWKFIAPFSRKGESRNTSENGRITTYYIQERILTKVYGEFYE